MSRRCQYSWPHLQYRFVLNDPTYFQFKLHLNHLDCECYTSPEHTQTLLLSTVNICIQHCNAVTKTKTFEKIHHLNLKLENRLTVDLCLKSSVYYVLGSFIINFQIWQLMSFFPFQNSWLDCYIFMVFLYFTKDIAQRN